jgi:hypothetical protein
MVFYQELWQYLGVAVPAAIFNNHFSQLSYRIADAQVGETLSHGHASFIHWFPSALQTEIVGVYVDSLKRV